MHRLKAGLVGLLCLVGVAGCTTNNSIAPVTFTTNAVMQLSVGSLRDYAGVLADRVRGVASGTTGSGLYVNAVSTFRNQFGNSAYITPGTATLVTPIGTDTIGTIFNYGKSASSNSVSGLPPAYVGTSASYSTGWLIQLCGSGLNCSTGGNPRGTALLGPAVIGTYTLATTVSVNGTTIPYSATATLPGATPILSNPTATLTYVPAGGVCGSGTDTGGGTVTLAATPALITERLVVITTDTSSRTEIATALVMGAGTTAVLPAGTFYTGPNNPLNCPITFRAFVMGADYPFFEAGPPNTPVQSPALNANASNTSNLSVSLEFGAFNS